MFLQEKLWTPSKLIKSLTEPLNATTLVLSKLLVVTLQVMVTNYTYWAYVPNPPINIGINWGDMGIWVVINESPWIPGSYDNKVLAKTTEQGKEIINCTVEYKDWR